MGFYQAQKIEKLEARIAALEAALKPFADDAKEYWSDTEETPDGAAVGVDVAWLRAARAAMEQDQMPEGWSHRNDGWR